MFLSSNQFHINICKENHNIIKTCKINEIKTNNFVMYLYNLFAKGLKEITFTQK